MKTPYAKLGAFSRWQARRCRPNPQCPASGRFRVFNRSGRLSASWEAANKLRHCRIARFDLPQKPHLDRPYAPGQRHRDARLRDIHADKNFAMTVDGSSSLRQGSARPAGQPSQCASRGSRRLTARTYGLRRFAALMNLSCVFRDPELSCWESRKLRHRRNATRAPRSCEPKRLEGDHHFSGSERNLGGELSGERFFYFFCP
jgi:hypothetical protein